MPPSGPTSKLRVLLVPDLTPWVTGTISRRIAHHNRSVLEHMGESRAAYRARIRSIAARPFDHATVREALRRHPPAGPRRAIAAAARPVLGRPIRPNSLTPQGNGR